MTHPLIQKIAVFKTLKEWSSKGFRLRKDVKRPFAWTHPKGIPMYLSNQVEKINDTH